MDIVCKYRNIFTRFKENSFSMLNILLMECSSILPDMIGGNGYGVLPDAELIVRWTQANTFMPTMQFGYLPWDYLNNTVISIVIYGIIYLCSTIVIM